MKEKRNDKRAMLVLMILTVWCSISVQPVWASDSHSTVSGVQAVFGVPTSTTERVVETEETQNHNRGKTAAYIPPVFGSMTSYTLYAGERLTPHLLTEHEQREQTGVTQLGNTIEAALPSEVSGNTSQREWVTEVTSDLYYTAGHIGQLEIPALSLSVKVYEEETTANMKRGVAHMRDSSIWDGNVVLCGHNRGSSNYFSQLHTLKVGDSIAYTTKLGTRWYRVMEVQKIRETDTQVLEGTNYNQLTLLTCVRNEQAYRYCVRAAAIE